MLSISIRWNWANALPVAALILLPMATLAAHAFAVL